MRIVLSTVAPMIVLLLMSCASGVSSVNAFQSETELRPDWVTYKPIDRNYYVGVGFAKANNDVNYVQTAKSNALDDLISEIEITVSSASVLEQLDNSDSFSEQYKATIKTKSKAEIEDYELISTWGNNEEYWVYYRLSRSKYKMKIAEKKRTAILIASADYFNGNTFLTEGEIPSALSSWANGLYAMREYLGEANITSVAGSDSVLLVNELYNRIQSTLNDIEIKTATDEVQLNRILDDDEVVPVKVNSISKGNGIDQLTIRAKFKVGNGVVNPSYTTDDNGEFSLVLSSVLSKEPKQVVLVQLDIAHMIRSEEMKKEIGALLDGLQLPQKELILNITKPIVYLESSEKVFGTSEGSTAIADHVTKLLSREGFLVSKNRDKADLWMQVVADTKKTKQSGSIYGTSFNLNIKIIDPVTEVETHHAIIDKLKSFSLDYNRSSAKGYEKAMEMIENETLPKLIKQILE
jgi:hypothetical protein